MRFRTAILALGLFAAPAPWAPAWAIVIELTPPTQAVGVGDPVQVDLNISGLGSGAAPSLGSWDVDIAFDPTVLSFTGASFGDQVDLLGLGIFNGVFDLGGVIDIFEVSPDDPADLDALQAAAFTLATLSFDTLAPGVSALALTVNDLGSSLGDALGASQVNGASVTVTAPISVPEPGTLALLGIGLAGLTLLRRRRA